MNPQTVGLVNALRAVNRHLPSVVNNLLSGTMSPGKQHQLAGLLTELGTLLGSHADNYTQPRDVADN